MTDNFDNSSEPSVYPIDGTLDLHQFAPGETKEIVAAYIDSCLEKQIYSLRIIHGKGRGVQREIVHSLLRNDKRVKSFRQESGSGGGWGATLINLAVPDK